MKIIVNLFEHVREAFVSFYEKENGRKATASERHEIENMVDKIMESHDNTSDLDEEIEIEEDTNAIRKQNEQELLHLIFVAEYVKSSENFYDLDKRIDDFLYVRIRMRVVKRIHLTSDEIDTVIRLCKFYHTKGICQHELSQAEIRNIHNWEKYYFHDLYIINNVAASFKAYWDDVLAGYTRPSARLNRINYLINHLNEMKGKGTIQLLPNYEEKINELIQHYQSLL